MRGISFHIPTKYSRYLWEIFKFINFTEYTWYIDQEEILYFNEKEEIADSDFFTSNILTGAEFKERISRNDYYVYLANIQAYPINAKKEDILTYDDFKKSECEIILLCADSKYVDLYSKSEEYIRNVYDMCIQNKFENAKYITDENDERTGLRL